MSARCRHGNVQARRFARDGRRIRTRQRVASLWDFVGREARLRQRLVRPTLIGPRHFLDDFEHLLRELLGLRRLPLFDRQLAHHAERVRRSTAEAARLTDRQRLVGQLARRDLVVFVHQDLDELRQRAGERVFFVRLAADAHRFVEPPVRLRELPRVVEIVAKVEQTRRHGAFVADFAVDGERLLVLLERGAQVPALCHHVAEIVQRHRDVPLAAELSRDGQALFVRARRAREIRLLAVDVRDVVQHAGDRRLASDLAEDRERAFVGCFCPRQIVLVVEHVGFEHDGARFEVSIVGVARHALRLRARRAPLVEAPHPPQGSAVQPVRFRDDQRRAALGALLNRRQRRGMLLRIVAERVVRSGFRDVETRVVA